MHRFLIVGACALALSGCVTPTAEDTAGLRAAWVGRPITDAVRMLGSPEALVRLSPTQVGYTFARSETMGRAPGAAPAAYAGPARTVTCRVTFVTTTPQDTLPERQRIIEDTRVVGCR